MIKALALFWEYSHKDWYVDRALINTKNKGLGTDYSVLRFWGLIVPLKEKKVDQGKLSSGKWAITLAGIEFLHNMRSVQKYVKIYNNKFYGFEGPSVKVTDCKKNSFSYTALMAGLPVYEPKKEFKAQLAFL